MPKQAPVPLQPSHRKKKKKRLPKAIRILLVMLPCLLILCVCGLVVYAFWLNGQLKRNAIPQDNSALGIDSKFDDEKYDPITNIALFGIALVLLGLFNLVFFGLYYKDVQKVGKSFGISCVVTFVGIGLAETCTFIFPFFRDQLDTRDPLYLPQKLIVLAVGILLFCLLTGLAYCRAKRDFQAQDL